jgi:hypothetical protein
MKLIEKIKAPTPKIHKILGRLATTLAAVCSALLLGDYLEDYPKLEIACVITSVAFSGQALFHAQKTNNINKNK